MHNPMRNPMHNPPRHNRCCPFGATPRRAGLEHALFMTGDAPGQPPAAPCEPPPPVPPAPSRSA